MPTIRPAYFDNQSSLLNFSLRNLHILNENLIGIAQPLLSTVENGADNIFNT